MTIRKIAQHSTSLAVSATTTQTGIFKTVAQQLTGIKYLENLSSILVPKIANVSAKLIDHLLYDTDGFGTRYLFDYVFLGDKTRFNLSKSLTDSIAGADSILLSTVKNRLASDNLNTAEAIAFLLRTRRTFADATAPVDIPAKLFLKAPIKDVQTFFDELSIIRVKNFVDSISDTDVFERRITVSRTFDDSASMLDAFTSIDGSTYSLNRTIREYLTVGSAATGIRNAGESLENFSFVMDKYLDPDVEMLDVLRSGFEKGLTEAAIIAELKQLYNIKPIQDELAETDISSIWFNSKTLDTASLAELIAQTVSKSLADTATMLDSMDFADNLLFTETKLFNELLTITDRKYLGIAKTLTDEQQLLDLIAPLPTKGLKDTAIPADQSQKYIKKASSDFVSMLEKLILVRARYFSDTVATTDLNKFLFQQLLTDLVTADDPLVRLSDGLLFTSIVQKQDTAPATDYFARSLNFYRYPHHGFLEPFTQTDKRVNYFNKIAKAGALTVFPVLRTNLIAYSEQFDIDSYWTSSGIRVSSNVSVAPSSVVVSPSPTYDAAQLLELFYNKPLDPYADNWYQIVPGRWIASSDGDLILTGTSNSTHYITTPNIVNLVSTTNFAFAIYVKYAGQRYIRISCTTDVWADFDLVTNSVVDKTASKASIQPVGDDWYLCEIANRVVSFGTAPELQILQQILYNTVNDPYGTDFIALVPESANQRVQISLLDDTRNPTFAGSGTSGVIVWGAQLEVGDAVEQEVSSLNYIRTYGAPATRIGYNVMPNDYDRIYATDTFTRFLVTVRPLFETTALDENIIRNVLYLRGAGTTEGSKFTETINLSEVFFRGLYSSRTTTDAVQAQDQKFLWFNKTLRDSFAFTDTIKSLLVYNKYANDILIVGTTNSGNRLSGDTAENVRFLLQTRVNPGNPDLITAGNTVLGLRRSGDTIENLSIVDLKVAKQGNSTTGFTTNLQPGNFALWSEDFTNAIWTKSSAFITSNVIAAPNGTLTADKLSESTASSSTGHYVYQFVATSTGQTITASVYAKAAERTKVLIGITDASISGVSASIDLSTGGTVVSLPADIPGLWTGTRAEVRFVGNGWYRIAITATRYAQSSVNTLMYIGPLDDTLNWGTTTGAGVYVWGAQMEYMTQPTNYVPTTTTAIFPYWNNTGSSSDIVRVGEYFASIRTSGNVLENLNYLLLKDGVPFRDTVPELDRPFLLTNKLITGDGTTIIDSFSFGDNFTYFANITERDSLLIGNGVTGVRRSGDPLESLSFIVLKDARAGLTYAVSGTTVTANSGDRLFVGQQYGNIRFSGDPLEKISLLLQATGTALRDISVVGSDPGFRLSGFNLENTKFTILRAGSNSLTDGIGLGLAGFGIRVSGAVQENIAFIDLKSAKAGTTYTITGYRDSGTPNVVFTSVTVTAADIDRLIAFDDMQAAFAAGRIISDLVIAGSDPGFRLSGYNLENTKFFINKYFGDETQQIDLIGIGDGLNYLWLDRETDTQVMGFGTTSQALRWSGSQLENISFLDLFTAKAGVTTTVSGTTVTAASGDRLFVGQQYGGIRLSRDPLEALSYIALKNAYASTAYSVSGTTVTASDGDRLFVGQQYGFDTRLAGDPLERIAILLLNRETDVQSLLDLGRTFWMNKSARQGTGNTIITGNLLTNSELFTAVAWTQSLLTPTATSSSSPITSQSSAFRITENTTTGQHLIYQTQVPGVSNSTGISITLSCWVKYDGVGPQRDFVLTSYGENYVTWNTVTGAITYNPSNYTAGSIAYANGWYRFWVTMRKTYGIGDCYLGMWNSGVGVYAGTTGSLLIWGAQVEASPVLGNYVSSAATQVINTVNTSQNTDIVLTGTAQAGLRRAGDVLEPISLLTNKPTRETQTVGQVPYNVFTYPLSLYAALSSVTGVMSQGTSSIVGQTPLVLTNWATGVSVISFAPVIPVNGSTSYTFSVYINPTERDLSAIRFNVTAYDSSGATIGSFLPAFAYVTSNTWTSYTATFSMGSNASSVSIALGNNGTTGAAIIDGLQVTQSTTALPLQTRLRGFGTTSETIRFTDLKVIQETVLILESVRKFFNGTEIFGGVIIITVPDTQNISEYFARVFKSIRGPRDGFAESIIIGGSFEKINLQTNKSLTTTSYDTSNTWVNFIATTSLSNNVKILNNPGQIQAALASNGDLITISNYLGSSNTQLMYMKFNSSGTITTSVFIAADSLRIYEPDSRINSVICNSLGEVYFVDTTGIQYKINSSTGARVWTSRETAGLSDVKEVSASVLDGSSIIAAGVKYTSTTTTYNGIFNANSVIPGAGVGQYIFKPNTGTRIVTISNTSAYSWPIPLSLMGTSGSLITTSTSGNNDDGYVQYNLLNTFVPSFAGASYTNLAVGTNSYITFGDASTTFSISTSSPLLAKIHIGSADNSLQRIYNQIIGTAPNRIRRFRFEGTAATTGTVGSPNIVWEAIFYETDPRVIDIHVGNHNRWTVSTSNATLRRLNSAGVVQQALVVDHITSTVNTAIVDVTITQTSGNIIALGTAGTSSIGGLTFGSTSSVIWTLSTTGSLISAWHLNIDNCFVPRQILADADGATYVVLCAGNSITGDSPYNIAPSGTSYLIKIDSANTITSMLKESYANIRDVSRDAAGNFYVVSGSEHGTDYLSIYNLRTAQAPKIYKYDSALNLIWARSLPNWNYTIRTIVSDGTNIYVTLDNCFTDNFFPYSTSANTARAQTPLSHAAILKLNSNGDILTFRVNDTEDYPFIQQFTLTSSVGLLNTSASILNWTDNTSSYLVTSNTTTFTSSAAASAQALATPYLNVKYQSRNDQSVTIGRATGFRTSSIDGAGYNRENISFLLGLNEYDTNTISDTYQSILILGRRFTDALLIGTSSYGQRVSGLQTENINFLIGLNPPSIAYTSVTQTTSSWAISVRDFLTTTTSYESTYRAALAEVSSLDVDSSGTIHVTARIQQTASLYGTRYLVLSNTGTVLRYQTNNAGLTNYLAYGLINYTANCVVMSDLYSGSPYTARIFLINSSTGSYLNTIYINGGGNADTNIPALDISGNIYVHVGNNFTTGNTNSTFSKWSITGNVVTLLWTSNLVVAAATNQLEIYQTLMRPSGEVLGLGVYNDASATQYSSVLVSLNSSTGLINYISSLVVSATTACQIRAGHAFADGSLILTGYVRNLVSNNGAYCGLICKLDSSNTINWAWGLGNNISVNLGTSINVSNQIHVDSSNNIYVAYSNWTISGYINQYAWVYKYNSSGTVIWSKSLKINTSTGNAGLLGLRVDDSYIYLGYTTQTNAYADSVSSRLAVVKLPKDGSDVYPLTRPGSGDYLNDVEWSSSITAAHTSVVARLSMTSITSKFAINLTTGMTTLTTGASFTVTNLARTPDQTYLESIIQFNYPSTVLIGNPNATGIRNLTTGETIVFGFNKGKQEIAGVNDVVVRYLNGILVFPGVVTSETITVSEYFARVFKSIRGPRDGFAESTTAGSVRYNLFSNPVDLTNSVNFTYQVTTSTTTTSSPVGNNALVTTWLAADAANIELKYANVTGGRTYNMSFYMQASTQMSLNITSVQYGSINATGAGLGSFGGGVVSYTSVGTWVRQSGTFTADAAASSVTVYLQIQSPSTSASSAPFTMYIDGMQVTSGSALLAFQTGQRGYSGTSENVSVFVNKTNRLDSVTIGSSTGTRYSGSTLENTNFLLNKLALRAGTSQFSGNLVSYSEQFDRWFAFSDIWVTSNTTAAPVITNAITAGSTSADTLTFNGGGGIPGNPGIYWNTTGVGNLYSTLIDCSLYARNISNATSISISISSGTLSPYIDAAFNLVTGTAGSTGFSGGYTSISRSITAAGGGWYKINVQFVATSTGTNLSSGLVFGLQNGAAADTSNPTQIYVWGASIKLLSSAYDYYQTTSAPIVLYYPSVQRGEITTITDSTIQSLIFGRSVADSILIGTSSYGLRVSGLQTEKTAFLINTPKTDTQTAGLQQYNYFKSPTDPYAQWDGTISANSAYSRDTAGTIISDSIPVKITTTGSTVTFVTVSRMAVSGNATSINLSLNVKTTTGMTVNITLYSYNSSGSFLGGTGGASNSNWPNWTRLSTTETPNSAASSVAMVITLSGLTGVPATVWLADFQMQRGSTTNGFQSLQRGFGGTSETIAFTALSGGNRETIASTDNIVRYLNGVLISDTSVTTLAGDYQILTGTAIDLQTDTGSEDLQI